jgi:hypothetical protein
VMSWCPPIVRPDGRDDSEDKKCLHHVHIAGRSCPVVVCSARVGLPRFDRSGFVGESSTMILLP